MGYPGPMSTPRHDPAKQCSLSLPTFMLLGGLGGAWAAIGVGSWWWAPPGALVCAIGLFLNLRKLWRWLDEKAQSL